MIGDTGLFVLFVICKKLKRFRVERGEDEEGVSIRERVILVGLIVIVKSCIELEYLVVYVFEILNEVLVCIGIYLINLNDFCFILFYGEDENLYFFFDNGVRVLL